jgi:hypothetical protein
MDRLEGCVECDVPEAPRRAATEGGGALQNPHVHVGVYGLGTAEPAFWPEDLDKAKKIM